MSCPRCKGPLKKSVHWQIYCSRRCGTAARQTKHQKRKRQIRLAGASKKGRSS